LSEVNALYRVPFKLNLLRKGAGLRHGNVLLFFFCQSVCSFVCRLGSEVAEAAAEQPPPADVPYVSSLVIFMLVAGAYSWRP